MSITIFGLKICITSAKRYRELMHRQEMLDKASVILASIDKKNRAFNLTTNISAKDFEINIDRHKKPE